MKPVNDIFADIVKKVSKDTEAMCRFYSETGPT